MRQLKKEVWPHLVTLTIPNQQRIDGLGCIVISWLNDCVSKSQWTVINRKGELDFYFRNGADATAFALRFRQ